MLQYRYWKITNIYNRLLTNWISASYVELNNDKNLSMLKENLSVSHTDKSDSTSSGANLITQENSKWTATSRNSSDISIVYDFKEKVFVSSINLKMRYDMQESWGQEWQVADIYVSDDSLSWIKVGYIEPEISSMDVNLKNVQIKFLDSKLLTGTEKSWFNFLTDVNPVFAVDADSVISNQGSVLTTSDGSNTLDTYRDISSNLAKTTTTGFLARNYNPYDLRYYTYNALNVNKNMLVFRQPIYVPNEFTFILKTKLLTKSVFLNTSISNGNGYLFAYETYDGDYHNSSDIQFYWRHANFSPYNSYTYDERKSNAKHIDTVILKGNLTSKDVVLITSYGIEKISPSSSLFSSILNTTTSYSVLGYTNTSSEWNIGANIIAYGLFDKNLSMKNINKILLAIDEKFLINSDFAKAIKNNLSFRHINRLSLDNVVQNVPVYTYKYRNMLTNIYNNVINEKPETTNIKIKEYAEITDYVYEENIPTVVTLYLLERLTGKIVAKTRSDETGYFKFKNIDKTLDYIIISPDSKHQFKTILKDYNPDGK